jgi:hypothetical protein
MIEGNREITTALARGLGGLSAPGISDQIPRGSEWSLSQSLLAETDRKEGVP